MSENKGFRILENTSLWQGQLGQSPTTGISEELISKLQPTGMKCRNTQLIFAPIIQPCIPGPIINETVVGDSIWAQYFRPKRWNLLHMGALSREAMHSLEAMPQGVGTFSTVENLILRTFSF